MSANLAMLAGTGAPGKIIELRKLLGEKFAGTVPAEFCTDPEDAPEHGEEDQRFQSGGACAGNAMRSGIPAVDRLGIPEGAITELSVAPPAVGCGLALSAIVTEELARGMPVALVDAADSFDPSDLLEVSASHRGRMLWARCGRGEETTPASVQTGLGGWKDNLSGRASPPGSRAAQLGRGKGVSKKSQGHRRAFGSARIEQALKVADLLLRDGNFPIVLIDLQGCLEMELRGIPNSTWFRLRNLAEMSGVRCLFFTPSPMVSSAALRIDLAQQEIGLAGLDRKREDIHSEFGVEVLRDRRGRHSTLSEHVPAVGASSSSVLSEVEGSLQAVG